MAYFSVHIRDFAASVGKDNFYLVGEIVGCCPQYYVRDMRLKGDPYSYKLAQVLDGGLRERYLNHTKFPYPGLNAMYEFNTKSSREKLVRNQIDVSAYSSQVVTCRYVPSHAVTCRYMPLHAVACATIRSTSPPTRASSPTTSTT